MSTIMTTSPRKASAVMQRLLAVALVAFTPFLIPAHATDLSLGYDANGNVNSKTTPSGTTTFNYDALDRVQTEAGPAGARTHVYDPNGNRTSDTAGTTAAYTPNTDKLQTINGITVTLDASGNLTRDGTYIYVWNALNQLVELHKADNTLIASYFYDYQNRRSRKVTTVAAPQGASTTYYTYDEQSHLIAETGPNNQPFATYVWNGDTLTGFITYQPTRTVYTVQVDQLGSPFQVRTLAGTVVWRWESEAYGKTQPNQDVDGDGTQLTLNLRFPGQYYDPESGLHYNLNRYYSPKLARYLTPDPIGLAGGVNNYQYGLGSPLMQVDPLGLTSDDVLLGGGSARPPIGVVNLSAQAQRQLAQQLTRALRDLNRKKSYQTYTRYNPKTGQCYSGRTSGYDDPETNVRNRSYGQALLNEEGFLPGVLDKSSDSYNAIRGREQQMIEINGGAQSSGGFSRNKINGISSLNPAGPLLYIPAATSEFGTPVPAGRCTCQ